MILCPVKPAGDQEPGKNLVVYSVQTGKAVMSFTQKIMDRGTWNVKWTANEQFCARCVTNEVHGYDPLLFDDGPVYKLRQEGDAKHDFLNDFGDDIRIDGFFIVAWSETVCGGVYTREKGAAGVCETV